MPRRKAREKYSISLIDAANNIEETYETEQPIQTSCLKVSGVEKQLFILIDIKRQARVLDIPQGKSLTIKRV